MQKGIRGCDLVDSLIGSSINISIANLISLISSCRVLFCQTFKLITPQELSKKIKLSTRYELVLVNDKLFFIKTAFPLVDFSFLCCTSSKTLGTKIFGIDYKVYSTLLYCIIRLSLSIKEHHDYSFIAMIYEYQINE